MFSVRFVYSPRNRFSNSVYPRLHYHGGAEMRNEEVQADVTIVGGGLAGVCAAIAAARLGRTVSLIQNRPVLGGNSSSEVRVWVSGASATGTHRYARENGIIGELFLENQYRNPEGNPYIWDLVVLEAVRAEPNIQLFLNTDAHVVEADGSPDRRRLRSVTGWMMGSERSIRFSSPVFLDCTGDGLIGHLAGARYRIGREGRDEYGESWAPPEADNVTLGSTILFYTKDAGRPVRFVPPRMSVDIQQTSIPERRVISSGVDGCHYWWIEWGGIPEVDPVHDNERVRDELWAVIYGIWDYIKNSGKFDAENMTLEWVGALPGKREYRRLLGDYVLSQQDIIEQRLFDDRVAYGGWSIDLHPAEGVYSDKNASLHWYSDGQYHIPFRSLYSINVENLLMAGRNVSASHVAFGTIRVMATCAAMGEAAGTAAALCADHDLTPRELHESKMPLLQQALLRQDAAVLGLVNADPADLARGARIQASSSLTRIHVESPVHRYRLSTDVGISFPVDPSLQSVELLLDADEATELTVELFETSKPQNFVPGTRVSEARVPLPAGARQWVNLPVEWHPGEARTAFLVVHRNDLLTLHFDDSPLTGILAYERAEKPIVDPSLPLDDQPDQPVQEWAMKPFARRSPCLRIAPESCAYAPEKVTNGLVRPWNGPNLWISSRMADGKEEWLELQWRESVSINSISVTFNDNPNEYLNNLHFIRSPYSVMPELVRDYRLEARAGDGEWRVILRESESRTRRRTHSFAEPIALDRLRLVVEATNGSASAEVIEIRAYGPEKSGVGVNGR